MDNVTHTLIGVALGEGLKKNAGDSEAARKAAVLTAVFASNAADLDFVAGFFSSERNLAYLLHHRGYTHTLLFVPLMAMFSAWVVWRFCLKPLERAQVRVRGILGIAGIAALLHIGADLWNDYGVHPFAPFWNGWVYGDFVYIIEPSLWLGLAPLAIFQARTRLTRGLSIAVFGIMLGLSWFGPISSAWVSFGLTLWAAFWLGIASLQRKPEDRPRAPLWMPSAAVLAIVLSSFFVGSRLAREAIRERIASKAAGEEVIGLTSSPFAGNPFLWRSIAISTGPKGEYVARKLTVSLWPKVFAPPEDYYGIDFTTLAKLEDAGIASDAQIRWLGAFRSNFTELQALSSRYCRFRELLRFSRAPFWVQGGGGMWAGDLRYDQQGEKGFSTVELPQEPENCPEFRAPWDPPLRADLAR